MTETVSFGQVNLLLVAVVVVDALVLVPRGAAAAGIGVGLATAVKLTPGVSYLVLCSRVVWRYEHGFTGLKVLAVNAYVLVAVALLVLLPAGTRLPADREAPAPPALRPRQPLASTARA